MSKTLTIDLPSHETMPIAQGETPFVIPKECKAGVVVNEGPDFQVKVEIVPVPEPGKSLPGKGRRL